MEKAITKKAKRMPERTSGCGPDNPSSKCPRKKGHESLGRGMLLLCCVYSMGSGLMAWDKYWSVYGKNKFLMDLFWSVSFRSYKKLLRQSNIGRIKNPRILEIGAGSGLLTKRILDIYGGSAVLVDNSLEARQVFLDTNNHPSIDYRIGSALSLKYRNKFDLVFSDGLIEHFKGKDQVNLIKVHVDAVKKGGHLILFFPHPTVRYKTFRAFLGDKFEEFVGYEKPLKRETVFDMVVSLGMKPVASSENIWEMGILCRK